MAFVNDPTDPTNMSQEERLAEVAAFFAEGVLRLRRRGALTTPRLAVIHHVESQECAADGLEVLSETRLHGQRG